MELTTFIVSSNRDCSLSRISSENEEVSKLLFEVGSRDERVNNISTPKVACCNHNPKKWSSKKVVRTVHCWHIQSSGTHKTNGILTSLIRHS